MMTTQYWDDFLFPLPSVPNLIMSRSSTLKFGGTEWVNGQMNYWTVTVDLDSESLAHSHGSSKEGA